MNSKIKNYVEVLFNDVPNSRKAAELKEEILSNLNEHYEALIREGKSENQAYTEALASLGDVDELLKSIVPDKDTTDRINVYRKKKAKFTSISVCFYILGVAVLCALPTIASITGSEKEELMAIIGLSAFLVFSGIATAMIVYVNMSVPQDVEPFITQKKKMNIDTSTTAGKFWESFFKVYWLVVLAIYFLISFTTGAWYITWLVFLIANAVKHALIAFLDIKSSENK